MEAAATSRDQIREKFLSDHEALRGKSAVLEALALGVLRGDDELVSALRLKGEELQAHLLTHMHWEETHLLPAIRGVAHASDAIAEAVIQEHREQRQRLARSLAELKASPGSSVKLAQHFLSLIRWLETDMQSEECEVLMSIS